jgi:hypothetical protein
MNPNPCACALPLQAVPVGGISTGDGDGDGDNFLRGYDMNPSTSGPLNYMSGPQSTISLVRNI